MNMRTIKFRGKNLYNNEWIFGDLIQYESGEMAIFSKKLSQYGCEATEMFNRSKIETTTVGQFTGLFDKNGKEIYEGDIVMWGHLNDGCSNENPHRKAIVKLYPSLHFLTFTKTEFGTPHAFHYGSFAYKDTHKYIEIIGNIHDNPELLEGDN